jgi:proteasome accessory factor C
VSTPLNTAGRLRQLLAVLAWLSQVGEAPIDEVADRFGLTPAALVAELELAACCGLPPYTPDQLMEIVVTDTTVATRLGSALGRPRKLSPREGFVLAASGRALLAVPGSDPDGALSRALDKLDRALGGERVVVELDAPPMLDLVKEAAANRESLAITYYSASTDRQTDREIAPHRVFASEGHWYVDAHCGLAGDVRRFRVDRISQAIVTGTAARPPSERSSDPAPLSSGFETFVPGPDTRTVRLSVDRAMAWMLESISATEPAEPAEAAGEVGDRLVIDVVVGGDAWLERLLLRLGPSAEVIDPAEDAGMAAEAATRILRRYRPDASSLPEKVGNNKIT